jgi:hypothetical protein
LEEWPGWAMAAAQKIVLHIIIVDFIKVPQTNIFTGVIITTIKGRELALKYNP